jgi:hypothetical protein
MTLSAVAAGTVGFMSEGDLDPEYMIVIRDELVLSPN